MSDYCDCCTTNLQHIADHYDPSGLTGPREDAEELLSLFRRCFADCNLKLTDVQAYIDSRGPGVPEPEYASIAPSMVVVLGGNGKIYEVDDEE